MNARIELAKMRLGVLLAPFPFGTRDQFMRWDRMQRAWANPRMNHKGKKKVPVSIGTFLDDAIYTKTAQDWGVYDSVSTYTFTSPTGERKKAYFTKKPMKLEGNKWTCEVKYFEG